MKENNLKEIAGIYFNRHEAEMAKGLLESANISSVINGDDGGGMWPNLSMGMGNYRLWVNAIDLALAKEILAPVVSDDAVISQSKRKGYRVAVLIFVLVGLVLAGGITGKDWLNFKNPYLKFLRSTSFVQAKVSCGVPAGSPHNVEVCREFYNDGSTYSETFYYNRQNHGTDTVYYPVGTVRWVGNYVDGRLEGKAYDYYPSGKVRYELVYVKDELNGTIVEYYDSGVIKATAPYINNQVEGAVKTYYPDGSLAEENQYKNGRLLDKSGQGFSGPKDLKSKDGRLWMQSAFKDGLQDGVFKEFDENGRLVFMEQYKENLLDGTSKDFYPSGRVRTEMIYRKDVLLRLREYDSSDRLILDNDYRN